MSHDPVIFETTVAPPVVFETTIVPPKSYPTTIQLGVQGRKGEAGGGGQTFDQDLNTTDSPTFSAVTADNFYGNVNVGSGSSSFANIGCENLTASVGISAADISTGGLTSSGTIDASGQAIYCGDLVVAGAVNAGNIGTAASHADSDFAAASHTHTASEVTDFASSVRSLVLTGLSTATNAAIIATDTVLGAFGKLQAQVTALASAGYQTASQVTAAITSYGYQTASQVLAALTWGNITGKPSSFTPSAHAASHASGGSDALTLAASQITSGTLADARLSSNVALDNIDNQFSVNQTFNGTNNTAPSQTTAPSASSILTRVAADSRYLVQPFQLNNQAPGTIAGTAVALGPFVPERSAATWTQSWGADTVPGSVLPFFSNRSATLNTVAINHTAGTHPSATLEVAVYSPNSSSYLPDAYLGKVAFSLSATGKKTINFASSITVSGLFWVIVRPTLGDTNFKAGGNGISLALTGYSLTPNNQFLSMLFGYGTVAGGVTSFFGYMSPIRNSLSATLPTTSVLSEIGLQQTANQSSNPTVLVY